MPVRRALARLRRGSLVFAALLAVLVGGFQQLIDLIHRHAALHHGHTLLGLDAALLDRPYHLNNSGDGQPCEDRYWNDVLDSKIH